MNWWNELTGLQQILATIAMPATLIMIVQFILLLFGFTNEGGGDSADVGDISDGADIGDISDGTDVGEISDISDGHDILGSSDATDIAGSDGFDIDSGTDSSGHGADNATHSMDALKLFTFRGIIAFFSIGGWFGVAAIGWGIPVPGAVALGAVAGYLALYFVAWSIRAALRMQHSGNININNAVGNNGEVYIPVPPIKSGEGKVNVIVQDRFCEFNAVTNEERTLKTGEKITVMGIEKEGVLLVTPVVSPVRNPPEGVIIENEF